MRISRKLPWQPTSPFATPETAFAPSLSRTASLALASLVVAVVASSSLAFAASALAAPPETPGTYFPLAIGATTATFEGGLDERAPAFPVEPGTYEFLYKATKTVSVAECESAGASRAPVPPGMYFGVEPEIVTQEVTGLIPATEYVVCLLAENGKGERAVGDAVGFATLPATPETGSASEVKASTAKLEGVLEPPGTKLEYEFRYNKGESCEGGSATPLAEGEGAVAAVVEGLTPDTKYAFCLVARSHLSGGDQEAVGETESFETEPAPPAVIEESVSGVGGANATLHTAIDPDGLATTYRFEYDTVPYGEGEAPHGTSVPVPDGNAGSGASAVPLSILVEGLHPGTTYHYRVLAHNSLGTVEGKDRSFTTQSGAGAGLIDGRGWEQVSPVDKHGSALEAITLEGGLIQASEDGSGIAYIAKAPVDEEAQGVRSFAEQQLLATRAGPGVWATKDIATPHEAVAGLRAGELSEYRMFSPDLSEGAVEPTGATPLSPQAGERTPYRREADGLYTPLVTPGNVTPPGTKYGPEILDPGTGQERPASGTAPEFVTATPDLSHVLVSAPQSLTQGFQGATKGGELSLYAWFDGVLQPVSILPGDVSAVAQGGARVGNGGFQMRNATSADGSRVFFESDSERHLFMRDVARQETVQLDAPQEGAEGGAGEAIYQDADSQGDKVFFTDAARLTVGATSKPNEPDLYMCEVANTSGERSCGEQGALKDLTVDSHAGEAANVGQTVIGASEDGAQIYLVADGVLTETANDRGEKATPGAPNLYEIDTSTGVRTLVAVLSGQDSADWASGEPTPDLPKLTSRVSPNGRFLSFMSNRSLTGFDNRDVASGVPDEEVFLYDSSSQRLVCASCDPTGARPAGVRDPAVNEAPLLVDRPFAWAEHWVAASIPGWTSEQQGIAQYQSRYLSNEGRLFFNSPVGLVPGDANGRQDVYEFEPEGLGGCTPATDSSAAVYVKELDGSPVGGCVGLVSSGTSSGESAFLDASGMGPGGHEGEDVFFLTSAQLSHGDGDTALDVYDAHVCSASLPCPSGVSSVPPACSNTDSCRPAAAPQPEVFGAPASATFHGPGNLTEPPRPAGASTPPCSSSTGAPSSKCTRRQNLTKALATCKRKWPKSKKKRSGCEATARHRYAAKAAKRKKK